MSAAAVDSADAGWVVVIPVKRFASAKSRLLVAPAAREQMARAMALDTVAAALQSPLVRAVVVVTDEDPAPFTALGAHVLADEPAAGLNAALRHGAATAARNNAGIAALSADLPALSPAELTRSLALVPAGARGVVPDADGTGTTLLAAAAGVPLSPSFGPDSYRHHLGSGAAALLPEEAIPGLRRDVDTVADLAAAVALGLGPRTRAVYEGMPSVPPKGLPPDSR